MGSTPKHNREAPRLTDAELDERIRHLQNELTAINTRRAILDDEERHVLEMIRAVRKEITHREWLARGIDD